MKQSNPLSVAVENLRVRLNSLEAYLNSDDAATAMQRVAEAPDTTLAEVTERARKYWDACEAKRGSVPPPRRTS